MLKISLITVTYNAEEFIRQCLASVASQSYTNIEHIIVDGNSSDRTISFINTYKSPHTLVISEPDNGIYDAMNKGISLATGDVIGILNADDFFPNKYVLAKIASAFGENNTQVVYGNLWYIDRRFPHRIIRKWQSSACSKKLLQKGWMPAHPTFYAKKELFNKYGNYQAGFKSAADYELMLRFLYTNQAKASYLDELIVVMRSGGTSNKSYFNILKANWNSFKAMRANKLDMAFIGIILKPLRKLNQYFGNKGNYVPVETFCPPKREEIVYMPQPSLVLQVLAP